MSGMSSHAQPPAGVRPLNLIALALTVGALALLAALPTPSARASTSSLSVLSPAAVNKVLAETPLTTLEVPELSAVLAELPAFKGINSASLTAALETTIREVTGQGGNLGELLSSSGGVEELVAALQEVLGPAFGDLGGLLGGDPTAKLTEVLGSVNLEEVLGKLLAGSSDPARLLEGIESALKPEALESLLGSLPVAATTTVGTVETLAHTLGTNVPALVASVGKTVEELPASAKTICTQMTDGRTFTILTSSPDGTPGSSTSSSTQGSTTFVMETTATPASTGSGSTTTTTAKASKVKVISHHVKGAKATVVVEVPATGKLSLSGRGVRSVGRQTAKAERVTLTVDLTKAGTASARKHHHRLKVQLKVAFKPTTGASSTAAVSLSYR